MNYIEGKVRLSDLAEELGVSSAAIRQHLANPKTKLAINSTKLLDRKTGDTLLDKESVLNFLSWLKFHSRKIRKETINILYEKIKLDI